jgi:ammonium transporter Rh
MTALIRNKFSMNDILNATLAGGVMIGASSGLFVNFAAALSIGLFAGVVSTLGYYYLTDKL